MSSRSMSLGRDAIGLVVVVILAALASFHAEAQENQPPVANMFHSSLQGLAPHAVLFNAINSFDADGDDIHVTWYWDDGSPPETYPKEGPPGSRSGAVEHVFEEAGRYDVFAIFTDEHGAATGWSGVTVTVEPSNPRAIFTIDPDPPALGEPFTLDGRLSFDRPAGPVSAHHWDLGDGTTDTGPVVEHQYDEPGDYTITLTVFDDEDPPNTNKTSRLVRITDDGEPDRDGDGTPDPDDGCPDDPEKLLPGGCGCGQPDTDRDEDGVADCVDECPDDPERTMEGVCGCGNPDTDGDGVADCEDDCPDDPLKTSGGLCGCDVPDSDSDDDAAPDCLDGCPFDPLKIAPQLCGCGVPEIDQDDDGTPDCVDECPLDPRKATPGTCGCGLADVDSDQDGVLDSEDGCPVNPLKTSPGLCGRDFSDSDSDGDGVLDCRDSCPGTDADTQVDDQGCDPQPDAVEPTEPSPTRPSSGPCGSIGLVGFLTPLVLLGLCARSWQRREFVE